MVTVTVHCPHCGSEDLRRNGRAPNGKQKYRCRACKGPYGNNLRHKGKICDTRRHGDPIKSTKVRANAREPQ